MRISIWTSLALLLCGLLVVGLIRSQGWIFRYSKEERLCPICASIEYRKSLSILGIQFNGVAHEDSPLKREVFPSLQHRPDHSGQTHLFNTTTHFLTLKAGLRRASHGAVFLVHNHPTFIAAFVRLAEADPSLAAERFDLLCNYLRPGSSGLAAPLRQFYTNQNDTALLEILRTGWWPKSPG